MVVRTHLVPLVPLIGLRVKEAGVRAFRKLSKHLGDYAIRKSAGN